MNTVTFSKIEWRMRRGMLELDLLFQQFLNNHPKEYSEDELLLLESLLQEADPDLFLWLMKTASPINKITQKQVDYVISYLNRS